MTRERSIRTGPALMTAALALLSSAPATPAEVLVAPKLVASDGAEDDNMGHALARSGDLLAVGAPFATVDGVRFAGAVYVFVRDPVTGAWAERAKLVSQDPAGFDSFGWSVAAGGDTVAVGAPGADPAGVLDQGSVHVFDRHAGGADNWGEVATLTEDSLGALGSFGTSVALSGDVLAVGAASRFSASDDGQVILFERGGDAWGTVATLGDRDVGGTDAGDGSSSSTFGRAVALDRDLLLIGATGADVSHHDEDDGAAYLFARDATDRDRWGFVARLAAPEAELCFGGRFLVELALEPADVQAEVERCAREDSLSDGDAFGTAVALDGDTAVIGASFAEGEDGSATVGAAYVFQRDGERWAPGPRLAPADFQTRAFFGGAVAVAGDVVLVGAANSDIGLKEDQGVAYVFERDADGAGLWGQVETLFGADSFSRHNFGAAVALDGASRLVGAVGHGDFRGAVYASAPPEPPPPPPVCEPAFAPTGQLADASVFAGPSGVLLGAVAGTLTEPLPVWINEVGAPAEPLPGGAVAVGGYYNIGADCTTFAPPEASFALVLPVPEVADTSRLAAALLAPAKYVLDGPPLGDVWQPVAGVYNPEARVFVAALTGVIAEGATVVLTDNPDLAPPAVTASRASPIAHRFVITCESSADVCSDVEGEAVRTDAVFREQGFPSPGRAVVRCAAADCTAFTLDPLDIVLDIYVLDSWRCGGDTLFDWYFTELAEAFVLCIAPGGIPSDAWLKYVVRHQLFHAVQFNFAAVRHAPAGVQLWDDWVIHGTADAAVASDAVMRRTTSDGVERTRTFRPADVPLAADITASDYAFETQDFWVYLFQAGDRTAPLGELKPFFEQGASTESVVAVLEGSGSVLAFDSLGQEYWGWVKNQVIEKTDVKFGDPEGTPALANPCQLELGLIGRGDVDQVDISWPAAKIVVGGLEPLQAEAVRIEFTAPARNVTVSAEAGGGPGGLGYKVYRVGEAGCEVPGAIPDSSPRTFREELPAGSVVYVVVASLQHQDGVLPPLYQIVIRGIDE